MVVMTALAGGPVPKEPRLPQVVGDDIVTGRRVYAQDSDHVFQAAGNIYYLADRAASPVVIANTLPRDTAAFTGRRVELDGLLGAVGRALQTGEMIPIYAIDGMPGVGKTTLAVHAAHLLARYFPDGQLFVDLRAYTPGQRSMEPADALAELLSADGVHQKEIPTGLDERMARWRARMADRRALIIIDNATGHDQVEWLLPGSATCLVMVTSRRRLTGLRARHAAVLLPLDTLSPDQAVALFAELAQHPLDSAERRAVPDLVRLCGYLPLAITLLAAKVGPEPLWRADELVDEIRLAHDRLGYMEAENIAVGAAFALSYRALPAASGRLFRRLGVHPGIDFDAYAAAAIGEMDVVQARRRLDALYDDRLLIQPVRGRYRMHDLVRAFAQTLASEEMEGCVGHLLSYYEQAATAANEFIAPGRADMGTSSTFALPRLTNLNHATDWMRVEKANLLACATYAQRYGLAERVVGIASAMAGYLSRTGPWDQALALHDVAAATAERQGDRLAHADAVLARSVLLRQTGDYADAERGMQEALTTYVELGDRLRQADCLCEIGSLRRLSDDVAGAAESLHLALATYQDLEDRRGTANALSSLAAVHWLTDNLSQATQDLERALAIYRSIEDPPGHAGALFRLGFVRRLTDDYPGASMVLRQALTIFRALGDRLGEADSEYNLGVVERMMGRYAEAEQWLRQALAVHVDLGYRLGIANAHKQLGVVYRLNGDYSDALTALETALTIYSDLGDRLSRANALAALGVVRRLVGDAQAATETLAEARAIYRSLGNLLGQSEVDNAIGALLLQCDQPSPALAHHEAALRTAIGAQSSLEKANALRGIARCAHRLGEVTRAASHLQDAVDIYRRIGSAEAEQATADLVALKEGKSPH
jgi:tetratricopeptide (TPR) repeat protein